MESLRDGTDVFLTCRYCYHYFSFKPSFVAFPKNGLRTRSSTSWNVICWILGHSVGLSSELRFVVCISGRCLGGICL